MHSDSEHITSYLIKLDPTLAVPYQIDRDVIWCKGEDCWIPGILNKTLLAMECMLPQIDQFDFVLRTTSSSFYYFPGLLEYLSGLPRERCYRGVIGFSEHGEFASGAGIILTPDLVKLALQDQKNINRLLDHEDVVFGVFFREHGIFPVSAPREEVLTLEEWNRKKESTSHFHFRVHNPIPSLRAVEDFQIYRELIEKFYHKNNSE
jgi:hypothetical protein